MLAKRPFRDADLALERVAVARAGRAHALVARVHPFCSEVGLRAYLPLDDARFGTKGAAPAAFLYLFAAAVSIPAAGKKYFYIHQIR